MCIQRLRQYIKPTNVIIITQQYICIITTVYVYTAGSKGAWGLDDYQFIIFYWGTSQLTSTDIQTTGMLDINKVHNYAHDYLLFSGIEFIHKVKTGPFNEHSVMLYQISQTLSWNKANKGLYRMYNDEVLTKYPIIQHVLFGSILTLQQYDNNTTMSHRTLSPNKIA